MRKREIFVVYTLFWLIVIVGYITTRTVIFGEEYRVIL